MSVGRVASAFEEMLREGIRIDEEPGIVLRRHPQTFFGLSRVSAVRSSTIWGLEKEGSIMAREKDRELRRRRPRRKKRLKARRKEAMRKVEASRA